MYSKTAYQNTKLAILACNTTLSMAEQTTDLLLRTLAGQAEEFFPAAAEEIRASTLRDFAAHLRGMAARGVNERISESLLSIADIADRQAGGKS